MAAFLLGVKQLPVGRSRHVRLVAVLVASEPVFATCKRLKILRLAAREETASALVLVASLADVTALLLVVVAPKVAVLEALEVPALVVEVLLSQPL